MPSLKAITLKSPYSDLAVVPPLCVTVLSLQNSFSKLLIPTVQHVPTVCERLGKLTSRALALRQSD